MDQQPNVIFLDAVGTLFGVRGSVGQVYSDIAKQFGVEADPDALNTSFYKNFKSAPPMAFPDVSLTEIPGREYIWWKAIATQTFRQIGVLNRFSEFSEFFDALYSHFTTAEPWFIYPDILPALEHWRDEGIALGIVSNFDSRIYAVLNALELAPYFESVTISTEVGAAKPSAKIFHTALQKHNCLPQAAWHIGDSYGEDYEGSCAAGLRGIWLNRSSS